MADRSLGRTLWNLVLALLNATLILVALCLWLAWRVTAQVDAITDDFAENLIEITPLRDEVQELRSEVAGLRSDLQVVQSGAGEASTAALARIQERSAQFDARLDEINSGIDKVLRDPEELIDYAIDRTAEGIKAGISEARMCTPALPNG